MATEKPLDTMCLDCDHLQKDCDGSHSGIYSGCIWKAATAEELKKFSERLHKTAREAEK